MNKFLKQNFSDVFLMLRYGISGVIGILSNLITLFIATHFWGLWYIWSAVIAFLVSLAITFMLQKYWTFKNEGGTAQVRKELASYAAVSVLGNLLGIFLLYVLTSVFGIWYLFSQMIGLGIVAVLSYIANKNLTFKASSTV